jgi:integrase
MARGLVGHIERLPADPGACNASPPHPRKREPDPTTPEQAARLLNLVLAEDEEFGLYLWLSFTTGGRRGEVTGLR